MRVIVAFLALTFMIMPSFAHETTGAHGGDIKDVGAQHWEVVARDNEIDLYVSDSDVKPLALTPDMTATATVLVNGRIQLIELKPVSGNKLSGKGEFRANHQMRVVIMAKQIGGVSQQARFQPIK